MSRQVLNEQTFAPGSELTASRTGERTMTIGGTIAKAFLVLVVTVIFAALGWRSALATKTLQDMGVPRVAHIAGGFTAWKESGAPVAEKAVKKPKPEGG